MKKINSLVFSICFLFFLMLAMTGCQKQEVQKVDDTNYIIDLHMILILLEGSETEAEYLDAIKGLKGNGDEILISVKTLEKLEQTVAVKNAIGVGKTLLRKADEAEVYFQEALLETTNPMDKSVLLSNLADAKYYQKEYLKQYEEAASIINEAVTEYRKVNSDTFLGMVLESNQISLSMMTDYPQPMVKHVLEIKKILKEERELFGANQFLGMFNLQSMGIACYYDGQSMERSLDYMEKALDINHELYQYTFFDIRMYDIIATMYNNRRSSDEKNLEYTNMGIELLDQWQSIWHYDRLQAYAKRGEFYYHIGEYEKSIGDYRVVLEQSTEDTDLVALSYYFLGQIYDMEDKGQDKVLDYYLRAFCIWQTYDRPDGNDTIKTSIYNLYKYYGYKKENSNFESWFDSKIEEMQEKMAAEKVRKNEK